MAYRPLADEIRPTTLDEVVGQKHILGKDGLLRRIIEGGNVPNLIFYGPSGTGKTTVANIIAQRTNRPLHRLNATTASISDIKDIIADIGTLLAPEGVLLYLDEIQYFNKKQQQSLLEFMENGKITLIASTTENPFFYVFGAVLSRSTVFEFKQITAQDALPAIDRGVSILEGRLGGKLELEEGVREHIASACGGDIRKAMNALELLASAAKKEQGKFLVSLDDAKTAAQKSAMRYDREGVLAGFRPGRGPPLSGPAAGGRGHDHRHPAAVVLGQRGRGHGLSPGRPHREGLRGQRFAAGAARGPATSGPGGGAAGHFSQV